MARQSLNEMGGEALREIGVLVFVFAILDRIIAGRITLVWTFATFCTGTLFFIGGCYLERRRLDD